MITIVNKGIDEDFVKIRCLAADVSDLPLTVPNGSEAFVIDNSKTLYFDEENRVWIDPTT